MNPNTPSNGVSAWAEEIVIPTYPPYPPEPLPMFYVKRNNQGTNGVVYPNPVTDRLSTTKVDRKYQMVYVENEYIQMGMLPEIGGRIFIGMDRTNGYDFFYRHKVIKPAFIGLFGPWISGGVEFNWPEHHRPGTYMPASFTIEEHPDGSKTVWMGDHDPLQRMKGMVGICLYPGKAFVETKVRLYNRMPFPQTFLWWENAGVHINEQYEIFFPPDVHHAVYHTRQFVVGFPMAKGGYNWGLNFGDGLDVRWYKNLPVPASFFSGPSKYEFFGGYDHRRQTGTIHVANSFISPGKKFFTWGNGPFGRQWQNNLYDYEDEGEYLELMAGVYTNNQPDFSWIGPYETKTFSQFWYPIQKIGPAKNANLQIAVNLEVESGNAKIGAYAIEVFPRADVVLSYQGKVLSESRIDLAPGKPFQTDVKLPKRVDPYSLLLQVLTASGQELIHYTPEKDPQEPLPDPYQPPLPPADTKTIEELYLVGSHLEQYRHPHIEPEPYYQEALRRDPDDARTNNAMGLLHLRRGNFSKAEEHFRRSIQRLTWRNPNPYDDEAYYNLGLALRYQGRFDEAYAAFYKSIWDHAWQNAGYYALAEIDCLRKNYPAALDHLDRSLQANANHLKARSLKVAVLRRLGRLDQAEILARQTISLDRLDHWSRFELAQVLMARGEFHNSDSLTQELLQLSHGDPQTFLDIAFDYANAGLWEEAGQFLSLLFISEQDETAVHPMIYYAQGYFAGHKGDQDKALAYYQKAAKARPDYCFPYRLEEQVVLEAVLKANPSDARAYYYLGNLLYDKNRPDEAVRLFENSVRLDPGFAIPWRNLGLAAYNNHREITKALEYFTKAIQADSSSPRLFFEFDAVSKRAGVAPEKRLEAYDAHRQMAEKRDDLNIELSALYNRLGQPEKAIKLLMSRKFIPWEGGEGMVVAQYSRAYWLLGRTFLDAGDAQEALKDFQAALDIPESLGEARFFESTDLQYYIGLAKEVLGDKDGSVKAFREVTEASARDFSPSVYYKALALMKLGDKEGGRKMLQDLLETAQRKMDEEAEVNYFGYFTPNVVFADDVKQLHRQNCLFLAGLAHLGLGQKAKARKAFENVLAKDPNHLEAYEEFRRL